MEVFFGCEAAGSYSSDCSTLLHHYLVQNHHYQDNLAHCRTVHEEEEGTKSWSWIIVRVP